MSDDEFNTSGKVAGALVLTFEGITILLMVAFAIGFVLAAL